MPGVCPADDELAGSRVPIAFCDHRCRAKKQMRAIQYTQGQDKKAALYKELIAVTEKSLAYAEQADMSLCAQRAVLLWDYNVWQARLAQEDGNPADTERLLPMLDRHIGQ